MKFLNHKRLTIIKASILCFVKITRINCETSFCLFKSNEPVQLLFIDGLLSVLPTFFNEKRFSKAQSVTIQQEFTYNTLYTNVIQEILITFVYIT